MVNTKNLKLLKDHIWNNVTDQGFDMEYYRRDLEGPVGFYSPHNCGTIGCALGHAPLCEELEPIEDDFQGSKDLDWDVYCLRVFNISEYSKYSKDWGFLFNGTWCAHDNTRKGFCDRAQYIIDNGYAPPKWSFEWRKNDEK